jgi:tRNA threonylcarbamoyladenosine biosynthesis protein TsaB
MSRAAPVILALDCSAAACSAALWRSGGLAAHRLAPMTHGHAEALMPMVELVMDMAALRYAELDLVAATVGPGSFTGLRIGLAAVRGLALAAGVPALGVTSFAAIAEALPDSDRGLAVAIDDRRGGVYWQEFAGDRLAVGAPVAVAADGLAATIAALAGGRRLRVAGDGGKLLRALGGSIGLDLVGDGGPPDAVAVARLAARLAGDVLAGRPAGLPPVPLYLRPPEVRLPDARPSDARPSAARPSAEGAGGPTESPAGGR